MADIFTSRLEWSGAAKGPARDPDTFSRDLSVTVDGVVLPMSSAPGFHGDASRVNPEQLFVAAVSSCQALTYLFLAAKNRVGIVAYADDAEGRLALLGGTLRMTQVTLRPRITLEAGASETRARELVDKAHRGCFIANSVSAEVAIEPVFTFAETTAGAAT